MENNLGSQEDYQEDQAAIREHNYDVEGVMQWLEYDIEYGFSKEGV